ncbi:MAG TPA: FAD-dependent oxidoreductase, partial [Desulfomonilia bacterium]|nr:FAD-dependent oxidoreductase [Desulfomonilia bacterium]
MPYFVSGLIQKPESLMALTADEAVHKRGIDLRIKHEVIRINRANRTVTVRDLANNRAFDQEYAMLVIGTGAHAIVPDLPGVSLEGIFTMKRYQDGLDLKRFVETSKPRRGVIVGSGYVGVEVAEAFGRLGMDVAVVEAMPRVMTVMDEDMSALVAEEMIKNNIKLYTGNKVVGFSGSGKLHEVLLDDGSAIEADVAMLSIGVAPNSSLAGDAGLELGERNAIKASRFQKTSDPHIYAAGDCCTAYHRILKQDVFIPLGLTANRQGRVCGGNIVAELTGKELQEFPGIMGTAITKLFDLEIAKTGIGHSEIERYHLAGIKSVAIKANNLPEYYPGSSNLWVKICFDEASGVILGGQIIGRGGSALRLDTLVAAISAGMTLNDLYSLDTAYAPPFAPV